MRGFSLLKQLVQKKVLTDQLEIYEKFFVDHIELAKGAFVCRLLTSLQPFFPADIAPRYKAVVTATSKAAERQEAAGEFHFAHLLWSAAATWHQLNDDKASAAEALRRSGEVFVLEADRQPADLHGLQVAVKFFADGIKVLRAIDGSEVRVKELHSRMVAAQASVAKSMPSFAVPIDGEQPAHEAMRFVKGKTLPQAILAISYMLKFNTRAELLKMVESSVATPFRSLIAAQRINSRGEVVGLRPGLAASGVQDEDVLRQHMLDISQRLHSIEGLLHVEPARRQIVEEHKVSESDAHREMSDLMSATSFCSEDRKPIFVRGLAAGLTGDFVLALHLLVPQIEESVRHLLRQAGVVTSGLTNDEIQRQFGLGTTLKMPELAQLIGSDIVFELEGLLTEANGTNLRNNLAHGLLRPDQFDSPVGRYFWWLVLRLVVAIRPENKINRAN